MLVLMFVIGITAFVGTCVSCGETRRSTGKHRSEHDSGLPHESFHVHRMNYGKASHIIRNRSLQK